MLLSFVTFALVFSVHAMTPQRIKHSKRSVLDIIPTKNPAYLSPRKGFTARGACLCQDKNSGCVVDEHLSCKTVLNIFPSKDVAAAAALSGGKKIHRKRKLRKLFAKWFEQFKNGSDKLSLF